MGARWGRRILRRRPSRGCGKDVSCFEGRRGRKPYLAILDILEIVDYAGTEIGSLEAPAKICIIEATVGRITLAALGLPPACLSSGRQSQLNANLELAIKSSYNV